MVALEKGEDGVIRRDREMAGVKINHGVSPEVALVVEATDGE